MGTILFSLGISVLGAIITFLIIASSNKRYQKKNEDALDTVKSSVVKIAEEQGKTSELIENAKQELKSAKTTIDELLASTLVVKDRLDKIENDTDERFATQSKDLSSIKNNLNEQRTTLSNTIEQKFNALNEIINGKIADFEKESELKYDKLNKTITQHSQSNNEKIKELEIKLNIELKKALAINKDALKELKEAFLGHLEEITSENEKNLDALKNVFNNELDNINKLNDSIQNDFDKYKNFSSSQLNLAANYFTVLSNVVTIQVTNHIQDLVSKLRQAEAEMAEIQEWHFLRSQGERANQITNQNAKISSITQELEDFYGYIKSLSPMIENKKIGHVSR